MSFSERRGVAVLTVPGLDNSGPGHWQSRWERDHSSIARVDLGIWHSPRRNPWVTKLDQAIREAQAPVVLVAHSLGCLAVAWWAALAGQPWGSPVAGALLVAPPDLDTLEVLRIGQDFRPRPKVLFPFASIIVASSDDPYATLERQFDMAKDWGSHFVDAGLLGHINAEAGLVDWFEGQALLGRLIDLAETDGAPDMLGNVQAAYDSHALLNARAGSGHLIGGVRAV